MKTTDWKKEATEYYNEYGNDNNHIPEWIDSLIPIYYYDIMMEANKYTVYHHEIKDWEVGMEIHKLLQRLLYNSYYECFMEAFFQVLVELDEEE